MLPVVVEEDHHQSVKSEKKKIEESAIVKKLSWFQKTSINDWDFFFFGMMIVMGAHNNNWNVDLQQGFMTLITDLLIAGSGFLCLAFCLGEMSSALPFSGGIFGFVRAAGGPFYGYVIACLELLFNTAYNSALIVPLMTIPTYLHEFSAASQLWMIGIVYGTILLILLIGGKPFWTLNTIIGLITLGLIIIYLIGSAANPHMSFVHFCLTQQAVTVKSVMIGRPPLASQFIGIQYLPLVSENLKNPRQQIPRMLIICWIIFFFSFLFVALSACSQAPGIKQLGLLSELLAPGFQHIFHISFEQSVWLHFPGMFASALGFLYCYGRQLYAIAQSGLLPNVFTHTLPGFNTPYISISLGCLLCFGINIYGYYNENVIPNVKTIGFLAFQLVIINAFICYIIFAIKFSEMERKFKSPFDIWGAVYGIFNFLQAIISMTVYKGDQSIGIIFIACYFVFISIIYFGYLHKHQKFSEEEKKHLFKAYLINANIENRHHLLKMNKVTPITNSHSHGQSKGNRTNNNQSHTIQSTSGVHSKNSPESSSPIKFIPSSNGNAMNLPSPKIPHEWSENDENDHESEQQEIIANPSLPAAESHLPRPSLRSSISKISSKVVDILKTFSSKVIPDEAIGKEMQEYQQLAILSAGGSMILSQDLLLSVVTDLNIKQPLNLDEKDNDKGVRIVELV